MSIAMQTTHAAFRAAETRLFRGYMGAVGARLQGDVCVHWECDTIVDVTAVAETLQIVYTRGDVTSYCMVTPDVPQTELFAKTVARNWKTTRDAMRGL